MNYPHDLPRGGTIGFAAPSFGCNIEPYKSGFENAQKKLRERGYRLQFGPNCYEGKGIGISNTPEKCAKELMEMYCSGENDCIISCGGGELMCEILSYMDFERIREAAPKWYMGYSDNTNFTYLQAVLCDTASIYGPCAAAFGMEPWHRSLEDAMGLLTGKGELSSGDEKNECKAASRGSERAAMDGERIDCVRGYDKWERESLKDEEHPLEPYHVTEPRELRVFQGRNSVSPSETIQMRGRLLGGCMDCLVTLLGTRFDRTKEFAEKYKEDGILWFLESCDLNVFGIRRAMWQMEEAGWFEHVKGFLIGRPLCFEQTLLGLDAYEAVLEVAGRKNVPVVMDVDLGHLPPMMPLIVGSVGEAVVMGNDISVRMQRV